MTPTPDTSPAAVKAMIERLERIELREDGDVTYNAFRNCDGPKAAAMLRALVSERDTWRDLESIPHRHLEAAEAEARALREALGEICRDSNPDWTEKRVYPNDVLDDIHSLAVNAYYKVTL